MPVIAIIAIVVIVIILNKTGVFLASLTEAEREMRLGRS